MAVFHLHRDYKPLSFTITMLIFMFLVSSYYALSDTDILLKFKSSLSNTSSLNSWGYQKPPCQGMTSNWVGVLCEANSAIWGVHLEDMGLSGTIDVDSLTFLPELRSLSFSNNSFDGPIPELKILTALKSVYLSNNHFSGEIPDNEFTGMISLKRLYLSQNEFTGPIPSSVVDLPNLLEIKLNGNKFSGPIPEFKQKDLETVDLSNNQLQGPIPKSLKMMDPAMFAGNKGICGPPLSVCDSSTSMANDGGAVVSDSSSNSYKPSILLVVIVATSGIFILLSVILLIIILSRRGKRRPPSEETPSNVQTKPVATTEHTSFAAAAAAHRPRSARKVDHKEMIRINFIRDDRVEFDLEDLLRASAEVLGSGCYGSSYKADLSAFDTTVVVKRYKEMNNIGKQEFQEHMRRIGRLNHKNLLPLVAYYYKREEKLLITDFVSRGSLGIHLHASGPQSPGLNWPTRLKIVKGIAKGMEYLYKELPSLTAPHGHLKSSNVLLDNSFEPFLSEYALIPVINLENAQEVMVAYKSPEYIQHGRIAKKTDIWALGILIIEILTGKLPTNFFQKGKGTEKDLSDWVKSEIGEDLSKVEKVFDKENGLGETSSSEHEEMVKLLEIGLCCSEVDVEKRLNIKEVVHRIEEIKGDEF